MVGFPVHDIVRGIKKLLLNMRMVVDIKKMKGGWKDYHSFFWLLNFILEREVPSAFHLYSLQVL